MIKNIIILFFSLLIIGCSSTNYYNSDLDNFEVVFINNKINKASKLALKEINANKKIEKIDVKLYRSDENDVKSIIVANNKKNIINELLPKKTLSFNYEPKIKKDSVFLKIE